MQNLPEEHFIGKVAQKAVIVHKDTVLLLRDSRETKEIWEIPGGRLNVGEDPKAGLARELKEELGVDFDIHEVVHVEQFLQGSEGKNALMIAYRATPVDSNLAFVLAPEEVAEVRWVGKDGWQNLTLFPEYQHTLELFFQTT